MVARLPPIFTATRKKKPHNASNGNLVTDKSHSLENDLRNSGNLKCVCGKEVNTNRWLKIHITKMKCGGEDQCITSGKTNASQSQENCSPEYIRSTAGLRVSHTQEDNSVKERIEWPPMGSKEECAKFDEDVTKILETTFGA